MPSRPVGKKQDKEPSRMSKKLYFFNLQTFFQVYLLILDIVKKMYFGLGLFVDSLAEL